MNRDQFMENDNSLLDGCGSVGKAARAQPPPVGRGIGRRSSPLAAAESEWWHSLICPSLRQRKSRLTVQRRFSVPAFKSLVVMAVDSMLRGADTAQAGIQRLHDQALVKAECSRVGIAPSPGLPPSPGLREQDGGQRGESPQLPFYVSKEMGIYSGERVQSLAAG